MKRICLVFVGFLTVFLLGAQKSIRTEHFEILYEEKSERTAESIAGVCEEEYAKLAFFFERDPGLFLPVYVKGSQKTINAHFSAYPSNHIVFYDAAFTSENLLNLRENIRSVFAHELTHAFNYNLRSPFWDTLSRVFGDPVTPGLFLFEDAFFMEGIAVYHESSDGFGRLNDPFYYQKLRQVRSDGTFPSWTRVNGNSDLYPYGENAYLYGSFFLKYLSDTYGEHTLTEFFRQADHVGGHIFAPADSLFSQVFGVDARTAWSNFENSIMVPVCETESSVERDVKSLYADLLFRDGYWYALSAVDGALYRFEKDFSDVKKLFSAPDAVCFDISSCGEFVFTQVRENSTSLVFRDCEGGSTRVVRAGDADYRLACFVDDSVDAAVDVFGNEKVFAVCSRGTDVFLRALDDDREIMLGQVSVYDLCSVGDGTVAVLFGSDGCDTLGLVDVKTMTMRIFSLPQSYRFRYLSCSDGVLYLSCLPSDLDTAMPVACAKVEFEGADCVVSVCKSGPEGGAFMPVCVDEGVFMYEARHSDGNILCSARFYDFEEVGRVAGEEYSGGLSELGLPVFDVVEKSRVASLMRGLFVPLAIDLASEDVGAGLTWITADPSETLEFYATAGYRPGKSSKWIAGFKVKNTKVLPVEFSFSARRFDSTGKWSYTMKLDSSYSFYPGSSAAKLTLSENAMLVINDRRRNLINSAGLTLSRAERIGLGPDDFFGYSAGVFLDNLTPKFKAAVYFKCLIPVRAGFTAYFYSSGNIGHSEYVNLTLLSLEIQDKVPLLPFFARRVTLETGLSNSYFNAGVFLHGVPMLGGTGDYLGISFKTGVQYLRELSTGNNQVKVMFSYSM